MFPKVQVGKRGASAKGRAKFQTVKEKYFLANAKNARQITAFFAMKESILLMSNAKADKRRQHLEDSKRMLSALNAINAFSKKMAAYT